MKTYPLLNESFEEPGDVVVADVGAEFLCQQAKAYAQLPPPLAEEFWIEAQRQKQQAMEDIRLWHGVAMDEFDRWALSTIGG